MEESKEVDKEITKKALKVKAWLNNPNNLLVLGILVFAIAIRIYYFILTKNQPLWLDEGEYGLKAKAFAFNTPETGWYGAREIVVPFIFSLILRIGGGEVSLRFLQLIISCLTIFFVYLLGKEMFDKKIALIATFVMAVNAIHLFFSCRILTYLWAPFFFLITFYLFYRGYVKNEGKKYLYIMAIVAAIGLATYGSLAFGILAIGMFLLITEGLTFLKKKELWIAALIGFICLIPQFIYSKIAYGVFVGRWAGLQSGAGNPPDNYSFLFSYLKMLPHLFGLVFTIVLIIGTIYILILLIFSIKLIKKNESKTLKSYLLIILWALAVIGFYTYVGVGWSVVYDGFVLSALPAFAFMTAGFTSLFFSIKFDKRVLAFIFVIIMALGGYYQLSYANSIVKNSLYSFQSVRDAGGWIKENSNPSDIIISSSLPQMTYYSEREIYPYIRDPSTAGPKDTSNRTTEDDFDKFVALIKPKYITDSVFEYVPTWVHDYPAKHNDSLIPVQAYYLDAQKTKLSLIIYEVKYSN